MKIDPNMVEGIALRELHEEKFRAAVDAKKQELQREKWWHRWVPFTIKIERRK